MLENMKNYLGNTNTKHMENYVGNVLYTFVNIVVFNNECQINTYKTHEELSRPSWPNPWILYPTMLGICVYDHARQGRT
jgi:hypothetical protein